MVAGKEIADEIVNSPDNIGAILTGAGLGAIANYKALDLYSKYLSKNKFEQKGYNFLAHVGALPGAIVGAIASGIEPGGLDSYEGAAIGAGISSLALPAYAKYKNTKEKK